MALHLTAIFGILLATLAVPSFGAPVQRNIWNHSCGYAFTTDSNTGIPAVRHGLAKMINVVKDQMGVAMTQLKKEKKIINDYYDEVKQMQIECYKFDWLPQKQRAWYNNEICSLQKEIRVKKVFQAFNSSLQIFSATFEELKKFSPRKDGRIRNAIIDNIHAHLKQVLCEVEWNLMCLNETTPVGEGENFLSKTKNWNNNPDETGLLLQDWGVILHLEAYLNDWNAIIKSLTKKNSCKWITRTTKKREPNSKEKVCKSERITKKKQQKKLKTKQKNQSP